MKRFLSLLAILGVFATVGAPEAFASQRSYCRHYATDVANTLATRNAVGGAIIGGIGGALIGGAIGGWGGADVGAIVGGTGGAIVGGGTWKRIYYRSYHRCLRS